MDHSGQFKFLLTTCIFFCTLPFYLRVCSYFSFVFVPSAASDGSDGGGGGGVGGVGDSGWLEQIFLPFA